jgi:lipoprotein-anchoring transpeptidase ErfK/SrfK
MKSTLVIIAIMTGILLAAPAFAGTTRPPDLTITKAGKVIKTVPIFDKWTDGATLAVGDLGTDGVPEVVIGAGPGSAPEIRVLRQDGSLINKFQAFDKKITRGVIVSIGDANGDGFNEIVAATGPKFGSYVRVFNGHGKLLSDWYPKPAAISSVITAATVPEVTTGFSVPAPHFVDETAGAGKQIIVDLTKQRLYAYENGLLAGTFLVSTGIGVFPTPTGTFSVIKKIPKMNYVWNYGTGSPYNYNIKNVSWNSQFATHLYMHEAYWHNGFGTVKSHGCVNMRKDDAKFIYDWSDMGTPVVIKT